MGCLGLGLALACDANGNIAGISKLWAATKDQISAFTFNVNGQVTGITMTTVDDIFVEFGFDDDTAFFNQAMTVKNQNTSVKQSIKMNQAKMDTTKRNALMKLVSCSLCGIVAIVLDNNNKYWVVGIKKDAASDAFVFRPLKVVSGNGNTGADSENDYNGFDHTLEAKNGEYAREWTLGLEGIPLEVEE